MDGRFNTIAGWVLGAGIVLLGANLLVHEVFKAEHGNEFGYPVNGAGESESGAGAAEQPIAFYLQTADAGRGERQFAKCASCHTINQGGANGTGPNLYGVAGEQIASGHGGYDFTPALRAHTDTWTWENLNAWITSPRSFAEGTRMGFGGMSNPQDRADLLMYLNAQGGHLTVPPPPAAAPAGGNASAGNEAAPAGNTANAAAPAAGNAAAPTANAAAPAGNAAAAH